MKIVEKYLYYSMACNECKKKKEERIKKEKEIRFVENWVIVFMVVWTGLAIYGLVSLISKLL